MFLLMPARRGTAHGNLALAFGKSPEDPSVRLLARDSFRHFAQAILEILGSSFWPKGRVLEKVDCPEEVRRAIDAAANAGRGVLLITGHLGNWEVGCRYFGEIFPGRFAVVAKRLRPAWLDRLAYRLRGRSDTEVIYKEEAARGVLRALKSGKLVAVLMDQNRPDGVFAPFFGRPAATTALAPTLAARTGAIVLPTAVTRRDDGRFEVSVLPPLEFSGDLKGPGEMETAVGACNKALETLILAHPGQWLWSHRRFKTQPS